MLSRVIPSCILLALLLSARTDTLGAQVPAPPLARWRPSLLPSTTPGPVDGNAVPLRVGHAASGSHAHTGTGLLIGGLVGAAATGIFLGAFCSGSDNACGADEVGRAILVFAVPPTVVGAVIGSLIRTKD
jgi:hypothetical protein